MNKKIKILFVWVGIILLAGIMCTPIHAKDDVKELKKQIEMLQKRVDELESEKQDQGNVPLGVSHPKARYQWDPFAEMQRMQAEMDRMFHDSFFTRGNRGTGFFSSSMSFDANYDVKETDNGYEIVFDMKDFNDDKIDIGIQNGYITVKGERSSEEKKESDNRFFQTQSFGTFMRTIPLPEDADTNKMNTEKTEDKLIIIIPKKSS